MKRVLGLAFAVLVVVLLSGCAQPAAPAAPPAAPEPVVSPPGQTAPPTAIQPPAPIGAAACQAISDVSLRDACWYQLASSEKNKSNCQNISAGQGEGGLSKAEYISSCENAVATEVAIATGDASSCTPLVPPGNVKTCINRIALNKSDPSVCGSLSDATDKASCMTEVAKKLSDYTVCNGIGISGLRDGCVEAIAIQKKDPTICENLPTLTQRNDCKLKIQSA